MLSFYSDLHVHSNISPCAARESSVKAHLEAAVAGGLDTIGFSNHLWDDAIPGSNDWYRPLNVDHLMKIRDEIAGLEDTYGLRILVGAEVEAPGFLALTAEHAKLFDYILVSCSHLHHPALMTGLKAETPEDVRLILVERFLKTVAEAADMDVPASVCHPFHPLGHSIEVEAEAVNGITDRMLAEILSFAAHKNVAIEAHWATMKTGGENGEVAAHSARFLRIAREVGCRFTFGSDCHVPWNLADQTRETRELAAKAGITPELMANI